MSTVTTAPRSSSNSPSAGTSGVTAGGVLRSEWLKLVTVRSTFWTTLVALLIAGGVALLAGSVLDADRARAISTVQLATGSFSIVALVVGVLGVLSIGGEYGTLQIRSSDTAVPSRWPVLVAKGVVVGAWSFVLGLVVTFGSFGLLALLLGGKGVAVTFDGDTVGALVGGASYLAIIAIFAVGLGALVRASAAGITVMAALLFVAPIIVGLIGGLTGADWIVTVGDYLLSSVGGVLFAPKGGAAIELWAALIALACWIAAVWVPAIALTTRRDV
jgi:ABC-2 type transport system permease protein